MSIFEDIQRREGDLREQRKREAPRFIDPETGRSVPVAQPEFGIPGRAPGETLSELVARMTGQVARTPQPQPGGIGESLAAPGVFDPGVRQNLFSIINRLLGVEDLPVREDLPLLMRPRL